MTNLRRTSWRTIARMPVFNRMSLRASVSSGGSVPRRCAGPGRRRRPRRRTGRRALSRHAAGRRGRAAHVSRRQAHGHRLRPSAVPGRRHLLPLPAEGRRPVREPVHDRPQRDAARGRARRHPRQPVHHRRHHRAVGRLQGVRQHGRVPALPRLPAGHARRGAGLRPVPRLRAGDEAAGLRAAPERSGHEHRQLQRRRRDRPGAGADGRPDRLDRLADPAADS